MSVETGKDRVGDVMVVGGGISGIQAALDLATAGFKVYLVEKSPTIGGKMAQLDKTFPTNDCSMCIESPKFIECHRHPNIEILTYTEVEAVEGEAGDFDVTLKKKPRYVHTDKCSGCTTCVSYCPVQIPDPFNQELSKNKAIHIYFAQAIPLVPYIDESCLYLTEKKCRICTAVCKKDAIDFKQTAERVQVKVGAIVLCPGYDAYDPGVRGDYGYGRMQNVVTSLDFERLLCATGPHEGEILRPSDKKHPHKIAWIHCVGSRQANMGLRNRPRAESQRLGTRRGNAAVRHALPPGLGPSLWPTTNAETRLQGASDGGLSNNSVGNMNPRASAIERPPGTAASYCSAVCCTYTQKQVILAKDHHPDAECTVFHNDIRSYGKDFERFYQRAENLPGIKFVRSYVAVGKEDPETKNVTIRYSTPDDGVKEEEFDLVVLSVGLAPPKGAGALACTFGVELDPHGFCKTDPANPMLTSRRGVFISGAFQGPLDIPESVLTASGAGSQCGEMLSSRRGKLARERVYPDERDVSKEEPRVGVYVCHCGANIGRTVDVPGTVEYAKSLPNVAHAEESLFICSTEAAQKLATSIKEKGLNRVVVAACTPRTHEPLFRDTLREAGINQYFFDMANIREHCSWVHSREKEKATDKARDIIRMSVARASFLEPLQEFNLPVNKKALVVGGGISGMTAALSIAAQGHEVHLVEKEKKLGGVARRIRKTIEGLDVQALVGDLSRRVFKHPLIHVHTGAEIVETAGYVGNFQTKVRAGGRLVEIKHGAVVVATGADEHKPNEYLYGKDERVMTQLELEEALAASSGGFSSPERAGGPGEKSAQRSPGITTASAGGFPAGASGGSGGEVRVATPGQVVMIQCVGCRNEERNYCARICCSHAIKNALDLKKRNPKTEVYVLFRDMRTYGFREDFYREAADLDVKFIRYEPEDKPQVEPVTEDGRDVLRVTVPDPVLRKALSIDADLVVLSTAIVPSAGGQDVGRRFKLAAGPDGFFQEAHVKLRPVDFAAEGVFLCGTAHYPKHITEAVSQAYGAAGRAVALLSQDTVVASGSVCSVNEADCVSCGACIKACAYGAIEFVETPKGRKARVNPVLCKGDGLCNMKCATGAIYLKHYTDQEIMAEIDAAFPADPAPDS